MPPYPSSPEDPIHIACMAPKGFPGANFTLYCGGQMVQLLQAPTDQLRVTFNLSSGRDAPGGTFRCQYRVLGEHRQPQLSDLSESVQVSFLGKPSLGPHGLGFHLLASVSLHSIFAGPARLLTYQDSLVLG